VPRLVLLADDGRELFAGQVAPAHVRAVAAWLRRNAGLVRAAAATAHAVAETRKLLGLAAPPPARRSRR
jgi:hypothetical protein